MVNDAIGTHITHRSVNLAEAIGAGRNFVSIDDIYVHGRLQNHTEITTCYSRQNSIYP
jgi:hypothetical protein